MHATIEHPGFAWKSYALALLAIAASISTGVADEPKPKPITLEVVDQAGYQQALKAQRGKVVLVDVWATWCLPCLRGFPQTVKLHEELAPKGLTVISLSLDEPDDEETVQGFLKRQKATFPNLLSKYGADAEAIEAFDIAGGAIPHYKLYDRQGKLIKTFASGDPKAGPFTHEDIAAAVEKLLQK